MRRTLKYILTAFYLAFLLPAFSFAQSDAAKQQADLDTIGNRLISRYRDLKTDTKKVTVYLNSIRSDGSWADIDYADSLQTRWKPMAHLERLNDMAVAFTIPGSSFYNDELIKAKILAGLEYFSQRKPRSTNWWYRDIGAQQGYMVPLLMVKGKINPEQRLRYSSYLRDLTGNPSHRGKNRSWVSEIAIFKGCIENNIQLVKTGFESMASTIMIETKSDGEGIKIDYSFHQHHAQLYTGGYGLSIVADYAKYILLSRQTEFAAVFTPEKRELLTNLMLNGHQLLGYRNSIDFGTVGRNITRPNGTNNISAEVLDEMVLADAENAKAYLAWKAHLSGGPFAANYVGNYYFWKSDIMTQHGADYYLSAKIVSKRTLGTEGLNGENLKGYNLPLGSTNIETTGNEYRDIAAVWDWTRIPGTTAEMNQETTLLTSYLYGSNLFGGGVSYGKNGAIAFEYDYKGIQAKKAYFFLGDAMVCLGAAINGRKTDPIVTSVNQCYLSGDIVTDAGRFQTKDQTISGLKWVHHDQVGYIFPEKELITVAAKEQSGTWKSINKAESAEKVTKKIFSIWIDHGNKPQNGNYQYIVVPGKSLSDFKEYFNQHDLVTIKNDSTIQAVKNTILKIYAVVFHRPGKVDMGDGLIISSNKEALVLISKKQNSYEVSVADPLCSQQGANITINKKLKGASASITNSDTNINVVFLSGDLTGQTVTNNYSIQ